MPSLRSTSDRLAGPGPASRADSGKLKAGALNPRAAFASPVAAVRRLRSNRSDRGSLPFPMRR